MNYRRFGNTDMEVSEIGFGAWAIGGEASVGPTAIGWGGGDDESAIRSIRSAVERGINFFDTADIYGLGHSEELLGQTVGPDKNIIIATKVGNIARGEEFSTDYSKQYILGAAEKSLKRLKRETIDYYQLHSARIGHLENGECIDAMQQLQSQGKIRYWGVSLNSFDPSPVAEWLIGNSSASGVQLVLNIINQRALPILPKAAMNGLGVIARMPLQFGLLTGKFDGGAAFSDKDHRKTRLTPAVIESATRMLNPIWQLCEKYRCSKAQLALSYVLSYDEVSTVIPGIHTVQQARENSEGLLRLSPGDRHFIETAGADRRAELMELVQRQG